MATKSSLCAICNFDANLQCSRCKLVKYCSKQCQTNDWALHKKSCKSNNKFTLTTVKNPQHLYDLMPDHILNTIYQNISPEDRFIKAFLSNDMSDMPDCIISLPENPNLWEKFISKSCIDIIKNQPDCKRIFIQNMDFMGHATVIVCSCDKTKCTPSNIVTKPLLAI